MLPPIILASQSPRRRDLLAREGVEFDVVVKPTEEYHDHDMDAVELCLLNAREKAKVVADEYPASTVIGADTLVFLDNEALGKPNSDEEARLMLGKLSGRTHRVCTAVSIMSPLRNIDFAEITEVLFKRLSGDAISEYLSKVNVFDKAGSYALQEHGDLIVEQVTGDSDNVIGLPVTRLVDELKKLGYSFG